MTAPATPLILDALKRAAVQPGGAPLHGSKAALFSSTASARQAAKHCKDEGLLRVLGTQPRGKSISEICAITDKGLSYLLEQEGPQPLIEDLTRALEGPLASAHRIQVSIDALMAVAEKVMEKVGGQFSDIAGGLFTDGSSNGGAHPNGFHLIPDRVPGAAESILECLAGWRAADSMEDCSLPELYRRLKNEAAELTIGQLHDALRRLHEQKRIYLHPWTGPLHDIPEPVFACMAGHELAYYASLR